MSRMQLPSIWLLGFLIRHGMYWPLSALPPDAPTGLTMSTMRGLEKRGYAKETENHCWQVTEKGREAFKSMPKLKSVMSKHGIVSLVIENDR